MRTGPPCLSDVVRSLPALLVRALDADQAAREVDALVAAGWRTGQLRARIGAAPSQGSPDRDAELVQALAISPDGRYVAAGGGPWMDVVPEAQGELVLRDTVTGKERFAPLRGLPTIIVGLAFAPYGWGGVVLFVLVLQCLAAGLAALFLRASGARPAATVPAHGR